jgi:hypothetical protein
MERKQVTALKAPRMSPFVLLLKVGWRKGRTTRDEGAEVVESGMCEVRISYKKYLKNEILPHSKYSGSVLQKPFGL